MRFRVALSQIDVVTASPEENLAKAGLFVRKAVEHDADLVCFPEMWTTGFDWQRNRELLGGHDRITGQIANLAKTHRIWINGSVLSANADGQPVNNMILFDDQGNRVAEYAKTHLFSLFNEQAHMAAGQQLTVFDSPWGRVGMAICYDLRFPELFRSYALKQVDYLLLSAAFPFPRLEHWRILLRARAIENQFFVIAANQVGDERVGNDTVTYFGSSSVIDPWGETVVEGRTDGEQLVTAVVDAKKLEDVRGKIPVFQDRRPDIYQL